MNDDKEKSTPLSRGIFIQPTHEAIVNPSMVWQARASFVIILYAVAIFLYLFVVNRANAMNIIYAALSIAFIGVVCLWLFDEDSFVKKQDK